MDRGRLLKRLDRAWEAFKQSYAGVPDAELLEPGVTGAWSIKDIIAHVTWWEEEALTHLPLILTGGRPPRYSVTYGGIDAFNARMTEKRKDWSLAEVLQDPSRRERVNVLRGCVSEDFDVVARPSEHRKNLGFLNSPKWCVKFRPTVAQRVAHAP